MDADHSKESSEEKAKRESIPNENDPMNDEEFAEEVVGNAGIGLNGAGARTNEREEHEGSASVPPTQEVEPREVGGEWIGWTALILAIASLFVWPAVLGPAAAVMGLFAYARDQRTLGIWSIIIGLMSLVAYLFLLPYLY